MRAGESFSYNTLTATSSGTFYLIGGKYLLEAVATWNSGSLALQRVMPDGVTVYTVTGGSLTANGTAALDLAPGAYKLTVASATNLFSAVTRIPEE